MTDFANILSVLAIQAGVCAQMGSPFSGRVLSCVRDDVERGGPFAGFFDAWDGVGVRGLMDDAVSLRILGGLQHLVLSGADPRLAAVYPSAGAAASDADLTLALDAAARTHHDLLAAFMASPPQTNEVRRSICLVGGYLTLAKQTGLPLRCLEIGASAGLNMNWDLFHYDFGAGRTWGDPASPLSLDADWEGPPPPLDSVVVAEKRGCDQNPIDVTDDASAQRLEAYVWPDQPDRLARLRAAIALARATNNPIDKADAAAWVAAHARPREGVATVVVHSVVWSYLPPATQAAITGSIRAAGESATASAPIAWLRMEPDPANMAAAMEVRLSVWPGQQNQLLAQVHPHGAKVIWLGEKA